LCRRTSLSPNTAISAPGCRTRSGGPRSKPSPPNPGRAAARLA
jgi:hypothetical protein